MFGSMRSAAGVKLALCAAVLLSVVASFGLHPEPGAPRITGPSGSVAAAGTSRASSHTCLACLTCGAAVATPIGGVIMSSTGSARSLQSPATNPLARLAGRNLAGRSPPDRS